MVTLIFDVLGELFKPSLAKFSTSGVADGSWEGLFREHSVFRSAEPDSRISAVYVETTSDAGNYHATGTTTSSKP